MYVLFGFGLTAGHLTVGTGEGVNDDAVSQDQRGGLGFSRASSLLQVGR
jgi:hypothetical protein